MFVIIKSYIQDCFVISDSEADQEAKGILETLEAHGASDTNMPRIKKLVYDILGKRFQWKNLTEKQDIESQCASTISSYNRYIDQRKY